MKRKLFIVICSLLSLIFIITGCTSGALETPPASELEESNDLKWPTKPITLLVGSSAGGATDMMCRLLAEELSKELGQPVIVENKPGSAFWVAWTYLVNQAPKDGYTFAAVNLNIAFGEYDENSPREIGVDDFELLANHVLDQGVIAIHPDETRFHDLKSLIEYSKEHELMTCSQSVGIDNSDYAMIKWLQDNHGCKFNVVPVDSTKDGQAMFYGKNLDVLFAGVSNCFNDHQNGIVRILCVASDERSKLLPDVPTMTELGYGGYNTFSARGYAYAKGVDQAIVGKMSAAIEKVINNPEIEQKLLNMGSETVYWDAEKFTEVIYEQLDQRLKLWGIPRKK
jgi:tripartite-type tricarboxylate transporter receptor subunit TctC